MQCNMHPKSSRAACVRVSRLPLPTHVLCVAYARRRANSLGNRVEQEPPLVVAVVVRRQLERRAAVERVVTARRENLPAGRPHTCNR